MKKINQHRKYRFVIFLTLLIALGSCKNENEENFKNKISELKSEIKKLKDSLKNETYEKLSNSTMVGYPDKEEYSANDSGKMYFYFKYPETIPEYEIYTTTSDLKPDKLILENQTTNQFEIPFNTNELKNNAVEVIAVFKNLELKLVMRTDVKMEK